MCEVDKCGMLVAMADDVTYPVRLVPAEGVVPGLWDIEMSDGSWRRDLTQGQVRYLTDVAEVDWTPVSRSEAVRRV